jgi:tetratricopeptide (TPR) repeat protein
VAMLAAPALASAQPAPTATQSPADDPEALLQRGVDLRETGRDEEALALFEQAWQRSQSPRARAQVALAEQALGRWVDAEAHLSEALAAQRDPWIRRNRAALEGALRVIQQRLGSLEVRGGVPGARVELNGRPVGTLPLPELVRVVAGSVTLRVSAEGYYPVTREVVVAAGGTVRESVEMQREPPRTTATVAPTVVTVTRLVPTPTRAQRSLGVAAVTLGGATLVGAAVATALSLRAASRWNDDARCLSTPGETRYARCGDHYDEALTTRTLGLAGFVSGAMLTALGVALLTTGRGTAPATARAFRCGAGPGVVGLACGVTF